MLGVARSPPCTCGLAHGPKLYHNGHALVEPKSCRCPRYAPRYASRARNSSRETERAWAPIPAARKPDATRDYAFLQHQWLLSPDTTGWLGGVHAPVRMLQRYVMQAAKLSARR